MSMTRLAVLAAAVLGCAGSQPACAQSMLKERADGALQLDGRTLRCANARSKLDARLPNLGLSVPSRRLLVFNPELMRHHSGIVRRFVFHHECGHQYVGASEMGADCWAVNRGVSDGWLDKNALPQICRSFGNAPESATHPAAVARCANLDRCFTIASESAARQGRVAVAPSSPPPAPQLVSGPNLVRSGYAP